MALRLAGEGYAEGGATEFLGLSDTPGSYSGQAGKYAKVKSAEDALEFDTPGGGGDMLKSVYDIDGDGIVDNSEKLEGSTKAQVQNHDPKAHAASHQDLGGDEISVAGLSGELADLQKVKDHTHQSLGGGVGGKLDHGLALDGLGDDDHTQYLNTSRHDTTARHPLGTVVPHDALANLTERAHSSLTGIGASDHHTKTGNNEVYGLVAAGLAAERPTAGVAGRWYFATDTLVLSRDDGAAWAEMARGETAIRLAQLSEKAHGSLTGVTSDQHHARSHDHSLAADGTPIAVAGVPDLPASKITSGRFGMTRMPDGTNGYVLTAKGVGIDPAYEAAAGGEFDFFDKFRDIVCWASLDCVTTTVDTGGLISADFHNVNFYTGTTSGNKAYLYALCDIYRLVETGKKTTIEWVVYNLTYLTTQTIYIFQSGSIDAPPSETTKHMGFKIVNADLYASNADGTTQKITDTGYNMPSSAQLTRLKVVVTQGTNCKFYVNEVLKVTHTENLPPVGQYRLNMGITTNAAEKRYVRIGRVAYEREH